jgi:hypothetical protein
MRTTKDDPDWVQFENTVLFQLVCLEFSLNPFTCFCARDGQMYDVHITRSTILLRENDAIF